MAREHTLVGGLSSRERSVLQSWLGVRGLRASFADTELGILRAIEETPPHHLILDTSAHNVNVDRLANITLAAFPNTRVTFLGASHVEQAWYEKFCLDRCRFAWRPLDPVELIGENPTEGVTETSPGSWPVAGEADLALFTRIFVDVHRAGESGSLYISAGPQRRVVTFGDGAPTFCDSRVLEENLGMLMLKWGTVNQIQHEWAQNLQLREGMMQGEAHLKINVLTQEQLNEALARQLLEKLVAAVSLGQSPYRWESNITFTMRAHRHNHNPFRVLIEAHARTLDQQSTSEILARWNGRSLAWSDRVDAREKSSLIGVLGPAGAMFCRGDATANRIAADDGGARGAAALLRMLEASGLLSEAR